MPTFNLRVETWIEAAHSIPELGQGHKCSRLHGHSYKIVVELAARSLDERGLVIDFGTVKAWLDRFDHQHLNEFFRPASAECFANTIWEGISKDILAPTNAGAERPEEHVKLVSVMVVEGGKGHNVVTLTADRK